VGDQSGPYPRGPRGMSVAHLLAEADRMVPSVAPRSAMELLAEIPDALLIDVREPQEYAAGHISRAVNIPRGQLEFHIEELVPDAERLLLLVCRAGGRSLLAARTLQIMGYTRVLALSGGMERWRHESLPTESDAEDDTVGMTEPWDG